MNYIGKDTIHYGCGLELNEKTALEKISHSCRKNIKKSKKFGLSLKKSKSAEDLGQFKQIWYYPDDPNFPNQLTDQDIFYLAYHEGTLLGGIILKKLGKHLFLNNLAASEEGKRYQAQSFLLWSIVEEYSGSEFEYIDIGVSYRPNLYRFFKGWATFNYPVIFNPPNIKPIIQFTPFSFNLNFDAKVDIEKVSKKLGSHEYTIVPERKYAIKILNELNLSYEDFHLGEQNQNQIRVIELKDYFPINFGAIIVGLKITPDDLWNKFSCYDFVKEEKVLKLFSSEFSDLERIKEGIQKNFELFKSYFSKEDVEIVENDMDKALFSFRHKCIDEVAKSYKKFEIPFHINGEKISFPCHQYLSDTSIEYMYGIYRGYLNLCSEWKPTNIKGSLKP